MLRPAIACVAVLVGWSITGALLAQRPAAAGGKMEAQKSPLEAKLIAKKDSYELNKDQSGEKFRESLKTPGVRVMPEPPAIDLVLELKNPTDAPVTIVLDSDAGALNLDLQGEGAVTAPGQRLFTREFRGGKPVEIAPGKTHEIPIKQLRFGFRGVGTHAYWTEPGEYKLGATLRYPGPRGDAGAAREMFEAKAEPIKLTVK